MTIRTAPPGRPLLGGFRVHTSIGARLGVPGVAPRYAVTHSDPSK